MIQTAIAIQASGSRLEDRATVLRVVNWTAVVAAVSPGRLVGASVGDSEAWLFGEREPLELTSRQRRKPFLGTGAASPVPFAHEDWQETLAVGTDGLWKYGRPERIAEAARSDELEALPERLIHLARLRSGALADDIAVVVCRPGKI